VQTLSLTLHREYLFLLGYQEQILRNPAHPNSGERLRDLTVLFVEDVVLLDAAISQISADYFGGRCILFVDCAEKLRNRQEMASQALEDLQSTSARIGPS
jgi:hypothetical protein